MTFILGALLVAAQLGGVDQKPTKTADAPAAAPDRVEIVLYSDFQCPFCAQIAPAIREIQTKGIDGVEPTIAFKNFPLVIHSNAQLAHQAAMAAKEQGKFWEMHDLLFTNQQRAQRSDLIGYAKQLKL